MSQGRYTIIRKLAEGGMAEIFLAKQHGSVGFEKRVVLKRIHTAFYADEQFRNMLVDEAHISMGLHHNNIAQILDLGEARGRYFLVLELVDGWDLGRILHRAEDAGMPLPPALGLYVVGEVCRALSYAHGRVTAEGQPMGLVHRDVSPQNVLVSEQGEVKLTDFGIAKAMTKRDQTASGVVKGKIAFMSPEQALGQPIDARSDLYSLGTLLYLVVTGQRPFDAKTDLEVLLRVQAGTFIPPEEARPDLPPALCALIRRMMQLNPDDRYQTADELLVDLEQVLRGDYHSVGQTELKLWLGELHRRDGVPPISRAPLEEAQAGSGEIEGNAIQLGDAEAPLERPSASLDMLGALESPETDAPPRRPTREATVRTGPTPVRTRLQPRITGREETAVSDLALDIADPDELSDLRYVRRSRRGMRALVIGLLLAGGVGAFLWKKTSLGARLAERTPTAEATPAPVPAAPAPQPAPAPSAADDDKPKPEPSPPELPNDPRPAAATTTVRPPPPTTVRPAPGRPAAPAPRPAWVAPEPTPPTQPPAHEPPAPPTEPPAHPPEQPQAPATTEPPAPAPAEPAPQPPAAEPAPTPAPAPAPTEPAPTPQAAPAEPPPRTP